MRLAALLCCVMVMGCGSKPKPEIVREPCLQPAPVVQPVDTQTKTEVVMTNDGFPQTMKKLGQLQATIEWQNKITDHLSKSAALIADCKNVEVDVWQANDCEKRKNELLAEGEKLRKERP